MNRLRIYFAITAILLAGYTVFAQKFTASAPAKVGLSDVFQLNFSLTGTGKNFIPPSLSDFNVYSGPNQSNQMSIVNGNMSQSITFGYYLIPKKEGTFTIGPASITTANGAIQSNSLVIEVVKGSAPAASQNQGQTGGGNSQANSQNLFARTTVSKSKIYTGEQVVVTHKVYTRLNLKGFQDVKFPSYNGFWAQEVNRTNAQYEVTQENIDGVQYSVVEIKRVFLFAQRSGKIEIEPMEVECVVREKVSNRNDPFEQFFGSSWGFNSKDVVYTIKSNALSVDVTALPEAGKPADFPGAVGNFSVNALIDKENVKTNDGINLKITISGKGNLKLIDAPKINFPDEFETYDPKTSENISVTSSGVSGSKTFEYLLIPRHEGTYKIHPVDFNYFDVEKRSYITLPSKEFTINVEKGEGAANAPVMSSVVKEDVKMVGTDIRYIKTEDIELEHRDDYFFGSGKFIAGFTLTPLLFVIFLLLRREHIRRNSNLVLVRKRNANKIAQKLLAQAKKSMESNNKEAFFENVLSALYSYAGNKMNIPVSEMSKEKAIASFQEKKVQQSHIDEFVTLLDECEFARYAPGLQPTNLNGVYSRAEGIITKIEDEIA